MNRIDGRARGHDWALVVRVGAAHCLLIVPLTLAGCAGTAPGGDATRQAKALQASVPAAIDCAQFVDAFGVIARTAGPDALAPTNRALTVRLQPLSAVTPLVAPGRRERPEARFAGLVRFRVEAAGPYAILVASLAWADVAEAHSARLVEPLDFKWVEVCGKRFKSGLYALEPGRDYAVQLWDSPERELSLMIRRLR